jgi:hypothetical protein
MKCFVISWFFPPINSSEGLITFKLLKSSKFHYDVFSQRYNKNWSYGLGAVDLRADNINIINADSSEFKDWVQEGLEYFRKHANKYDFIMSRSMPPESHSLALAIKKEFPHISWVASFGDPIANNPYHDYTKAISPHKIGYDGIGNYSLKRYFSPIRILRHYVWLVRQRRHKKIRAQERVLENQIINHADRLIFNNKNQRDFIIEPYANSIKDKSIVLPHTFDTDMYPRRKDKKASGPIVVRHIGQLNNVRTSLSVLRALEKIHDKDVNLRNKVRIEFYGNISNKEKLFLINKDLTDIVKVKKPVTYIDSLKLMKNSDWLLLIDANLPIPRNIFCAAKLADYLGSKTPILGVTMVDGASADILRETGGVVASHDVDDIYIYLSKIIYQNYSVNIANVKEFDAKNVANDFDKKVRALLS